MKPSQVRSRILEDHARLRILFQELDDVAARVQAGERGLIPKLHSLGEALSERFLDHLDLEDALLVPAVREADAWGEERASRVATEHLEQRERFARLMRELANPPRGEVELAAELRDLVSDLFTDMMHEEKTVLDADLLRDDVISIDSETG